MSLKILIYLKKKEAMEKIKEFVEKLLTYHIKKIKKRKKRF